MQKGERVGTLEHIYGAKFENYVPIRQAVSWTRSGSVLLLGSLGSVLHILKYVYC